MASPLSPTPTTRKIEMLIAPISGHQLKNSGRKPLQPKKQSATPITNVINPKPPERIQLDNANKENVPPTYSTTTTPVRKQPFQIEPFDTSLAQELTAIREKLDRLRIDKENTDEMLTERSMQLDLRMKKFIQKSELQKQLEIELDHLYRLNQIILSSMRRSPLRSMRDKEQENKMKQEQTKGSNITEERDEPKEESLVTSLNSEE